MRFFRFIAYVPRPRRRRQYPVRGFIHTHRPCGDTLTLALLGARNYVGLDSIDPISKALLDGLMVCKLIVHVPSDQPLPIHDIWYLALVHKLKQFHA